jgi:hypothetical protein
MARAAKDDVENILDTWIRPSHLRAAAGLVPLPID